MADIGSTLREARMRARIDISEVEVGTKIRAKYLRALENEEWDLLPGPVYVKSFLKTYGDYLGLDSRLLVDEFKRRYERPSDHEVRAMATTARERDRRSGARSPGRIGSALMGPRAVIVMAVVVIVLALVVLNQKGKTPSGSGNPIAPATNTTGSRHHHHRSAGKRGGGRTTTRTNTRTTGTTTRTTTTPANEATLALVPTSRVWVCVETAAGTPLINQTYDQGEKIPTESSSTLLVNLGNNDIDVKVNGKPYTLQSTSAIGLKITSTGATTLNPAPTCGDG